VVSNSEGKNMWLPNSTLGISLDPYLEWMSAKERAHQLELREDRVRRLREARERASDADASTSRQPEAA